MGCRSSKCFECIDTDGRSYIFEALTAKSQVLIVSIDDEPPQIVTKLHIQDGGKVTLEFRDAKSITSRFTEDNAQAIDALASTIGKGAGVPEVVPYCALRIICINDVYELDSLANLATCRKELAVGTTICVLAGDFISPSLLSSLDKGKAMVDTLNRVGVDYVCIGNHEADIPHAQLLKRVKESRFTWINSNMQRLPMDADTKMPRYCELELRAGDHKRRIALAGLNTEDPLLYTSATWSGLGSSCIDPVLPTFHDLQKELLGAGFDVVLPMTHQLMQRDREMAQATSDLPLIIGGHDHDPYYEVVEGTHILKMGSDALKIGVIDLVWNDASTPGSSPTVKVEQYAATNFAADPSVKTAIDEHKKLLDALDMAALCPAPPGVVLSSKGVRAGQTTMGTLLVSTLRDAMDADCACINGGAIRGNTAYDADTASLTYGDLKVQVPYDSEVVVVMLPGSLIKEMVTFSRSFATQDPPPKKLPGCFLQIDDKMTWDEPTQTVTHIAGKPLDLGMMYRCAVLFFALDGLDDVKPLVDYCKAHKGDVPDSVDSARKLKDVLADYFAKRMFWDIFKNECAYSTFDLNGDGVLSMDEVSGAMQKRLGKSIGTLLLDNIFSVVDKDMSGELDPVEWLRMCFLSRDAVGETTTLTSEEMHAFAKEVLGTAYSKEVAQPLIDKMISLAENSKDGTANVVRGYGNRVTQLAPVCI